MAKMRKVPTMRGYALFAGTHHVEVEETGGYAQEKTGTKKIIAFYERALPEGVKVKFAAAEEGGTGPAPQA